MIRDDALEALPVRAALPALNHALADDGAAVLVAPPGTGKTTLVPLVLAGLVGGGPARRVLVAEPRRIAARAAARRMAWLLGQDVGEDIGFTVRGERVVGRRARVEVVTTGVLLQRLQRDQELPGVDVVVLDECHERHLDADTAAAFLLDVRGTLRPELRLLAASATTDAQGWARLLGGAPVVEAEGVSHPVEVVWAPPARPVRPPHGMRVDPALLAHTASVVRRALAERPGDVLCFLPGLGEIARVAGLLGDLGAVDVLQVHGRAPAAVQDAVLSPGARRRVVLATSVAESSLTVPGVRVVVDAGLAREPRVDHARGLSGLTTVRSSRAAGRQRAGRAGREAPGVVYRCWAEAEDVRLPPFPAPEIKVADLTAFALQAACWGDPEASGLALLDPPPGGAMAAARQVLTAVGAVDPRGRATRRGTRLVRGGLHPRLGRALLDTSGAAAEVVALLSEEVPRSYGDDLSAALRTARRGGDAYAARWRAEVRRLRAVAAERGGRNGTGGVPEDDGARGDGLVGRAVALAFPERVARLEGGSYLMASGTRAELGEGSALRGTPWIVVAVADRPAGSGHARVRLAAPVEEDVAREAAAALRTEEEEVRWAEGDVLAQRVERLGAIGLTVRPLKDPPPGLVREALLEGLRREGLGLLRWSPEAVALRQRLAFLRLRRGEPWPDVSDGALHAHVAQWLEPELGRARRRADLARIDAGQALARLLPWASGEAARLDELAPERITVPSGSRIRVDYGDPERPVLAVKLQEMFGLDSSPVLAGVPVLVHLLSPAGRPAAVTADLASFWREGYRAVRAELRGRYPRHPWPEDPAAAEPTRHTKARPRR
ncbi:MULTISPECIES: ATP-dependent helicase HrpB [Streptomyces]|uniref:ATP-dependent helicase HrpB n=2 Tax=Streptomyces griseoaurantiacus TaxID=68213 RepID=A0ABZ1V6H9_9ACTN|nr:MULTISPECIES: ATP-dependent helicase HrpB [Streptomyces]MBA5222273.1 ATP-dependent helicase HrpB [Streptomyces griseoaurantiacus]MDX3089921.1 ATP-dependent helicase HrpB [Streptomyces sp. ME12-02E]MDX3335535.1 ATP-dependent helicase HrpB [Streptomyces sp. ME02-6978a]MDX3360486.1 ATP-dependent helicase HrpB [Streptomyces sp. ME02-6978.2a]